MHPASQELYHEGDLVRIYRSRYSDLDDTNAHVIFPVRVGESYVCPHCGVMCKTNPAYGRSDAVGYMLSTPVPDNCCSPWGYTLLKRERQPHPADFNTIIKELNS